MKTTYRLFTALLSIPLLLSGCMALDELPDANAFLAPTVTLNDAAPKASSVATVLSAGYSSPKGVKVNVEDCGFYYSFNDDFSNAGSVSCGKGTEGKFTANVSFKDYGKVFHYKAYISDGKGEILSDAKSYTIPPFQTHLSIGQPSMDSYTGTSATIVCDIVADDGINITERGICYGKSEELDIQSDHKSCGSGTGQLKAEISGLQTGERFFARGYAKEGDNIAYGKSVSLMVYALPAVATADVTSIGGTTAVSGGNVTSDGGSSVTARGVVWSTTSGPTVSLSTKTSNGTGTGSFTSMISNLSPGTKYYVRAYATNGSGTSYGTELTFTTKVITPTVTTSGASSVTANSATVGGNVTDAGGADVTERGVVWSTSQNPTTSGSKKAVGSGTGSFSTTLTGLSVATTYYVRAYAINSAGTSYGDQVSFKTNDDHKENEGDTEDVGNSEYEWGDSPSGKYEYVDLGLSVKWATCNVGASKPEDYGDYFAWGETEPYYQSGYAQEDPQSHWKSGKSSGYGWSSYKYCKGSSSTMTKYCDKSSYGYNGFTDGKTVLDLEDDAARVNWGGSWRMPTQKEFDELCNSSNCTWTWTTMNGVKGYKVVSKKSGYAGNYIFLPAAGDRLDTYLDSVGSYGYYWSSSLYAGNPHYACSLYFSSGHYYTYGSSRGYGLSVRPVCH